MSTEPVPIFEPKARLGRIAILWRGDELARRNASPETGRFKAVFAALADVGIDAEPVVYEDDVLDAVRAQLVTFDGVLVWVNPIHEGRNRANLDALLREVAAHGVEDIVLVDHRFRIDADFAERGEDSLKPARLWRGIAARLFIAPR